MRKSKLFVIYFPVSLVILQVIGNILYLIKPEWYNSIGFYLNTLLGTNAGVALFFIVFTFSFQFCAISRWAAIAEGLFALNYLIVQQDNLYNIMFQIIVGAVAIAATFWHYVNKFPLCKLSLFTGFIASVIKTGSCKRGLDNWDRNVESLLLKKRRHETNS